MTVSPANDNLISKLRELSIAQPYIICASPRTGSNLLCHTLKRTSLCGKPEEFFFENNESKYRRIWGLPDDLSYSDYVVETVKNTRTTNDVYGFKIMYSHFLRFAKSLREIVDFPSSESDLALLELLFPNIKFIWISRRDKVRQAISWTKASQSEVWHSGQKIKKQNIEYHYDPYEIDKYYMWAMKGDVRWQRFFEHQGIEPVHVIYEDLIADYQPTTIKVLEHIGFEDAENIRLPDAPGLKKQADSLSEQWYLQYLYDIGELSAKHYQQQRQELEN